MKEQSKLILKSAGISLCITSLMVVGYLINSNKSDPITYNDTVKTIDSNTTITEAPQKTPAKNEDIAPVADAESEVAQKEGNIYQLSEGGFNDFELYIKELCAYNFEKASDIALNSTNPIMQSLFQDSAMLIHINQLKVQENEKEISKKLRNHTIKNPINFFVCALYVNSYYRTPLIHAKDSLNPEFEILDNLVIEAVEDTYEIGNALQVYHATFTLDGYNMEAIFYAKDDGYAIYKIFSLEEVPYLTVEKFEQIRGAYVD